MQAMEKNGQQGYILQNPARGQREEGSKVRGGEVK